MYRELERQTKSRDIKEEAHNHCPSPGESEIIPRPPNECWLGFEKPGPFFHELHIPNYPAGYSPQSGGALINYPWTGLILPTETLEWPFLSRPLSQPESNKALALSQMLCPH